MRSFLNSSRRPSSSSGKLACAVALACLTSASAFAQSTYATLTGTVTDVTGAVVPNATVTVTNEATGLKRSVKADASGEFRVINLDPGTYTILFNGGDAFAPERDEHVSIPARETIRTDAHLTLGSVAQETTVIANQDVVTEDLTLSNSLSGTEVNQLPLNFRATDAPSPINVAALTPAVNLDAGNNLTFAGQLPTATSFSIDGISIQLVRNGGPTRDLFPSVEDIDEFRVNTAGGSAEFAQPTDLTVTTKGGSNKFHGSAYWFAQRKGWDSTDQIAKEALGANGNDYGVVASGPIWKDHTFFFFDYETDRLGQNTLIQTQTYPTAWTQGNFGGVGNVAGAVPFQLYIPGTAIPIPGNNLAAIGGVNATTAKILPLFFPTPTDSQQSLDATGDLNLTQVFPGQYKLNGYDGRIDHTFNSKHSIFGRITDKQISSTGTDVPGDATYNPLMGTFSTISDLVNFAVSYNWIITPTIVNELRGGFTNANFILSYPQAATGNADITNFGIAGTPGPPKNGLNGVPVFYVGNLLGGVTDNDGHPNITKNNIFEIGDNLSWTHGKFNSKFGVDFRRLFYTANIDFIDGDEYGDYHASGALGFCPLPGEIAAYPDACGAAQFDTGYLDYATQAQNGPDGKPYDYHYDVFGQTDYKVNDRLTLTLGLRYELNTPFIDQTNQLGNFLTQVPGGALLYNKGENINPIWAQAVGSTPFIQNGTNGFNYPAGLRFLDKSNIQPRLGFAYRPLPHNDGVLKASVGEYSVPVLGAVLYSLLGVDTSYYGVYASTAADPLNWSNVFAAAPGQGSAYPGYRRANQFNLKDPRELQWNVAYDQSIGKKILGRITYIGSHTYDLIESPDLNQVQPNTTGLASGTAALNALTPTQRAAILKYPNFNEVLTRQNGPSDIYNALILEANRRFEQGLSFTAAYTLTSNQTNALGTAPSSAIPSGGQGDNGNNVQDLYNIKQDTGAAYYDPRHKFLATAVYDLPFGKGRQFANNLNPVEDLFVGGWSTTGIFLFHTGNFLTPYFPSTVSDPSGTNPSERSVAQQRPDCLGNSAAPDAHSLAHYFNSAAYSIPGNNIGRFGNCGVGILTGPKTTTFSMSAGKNFAITERFTLRYEAEFANLFNIANWANPNMNVSSSSFGQITSSALFNNGSQSGPRTIEMSLHLHY